MPGEAIGADRSAMREGVAHSFRDLRRDRLGLGIAIGAGASATSLRWNSPISIVSASPPDTRAWPRRNFLSDRNPIDCPGRHHWPDPDENPMT
jgi:hypothetical protein